MNPRRRNALLIALATILMAIVVWAVWPKKPPTQFSASAWRAIPEDRREPMATDFIAKHFRPGMTRAEVIALLGNSHPAFPQELQYIVGHASIDYRVLWIRLDDVGKAVSATIYQTS